MCASTLGQLRHSFAVFFGDSKSTLSAYEDGIELDSPRKILVTKNYVTALERLSGKPLNKCQCRLDYFDMFGNKASLEFSMYENEFLALKADLGK